VGDQFFRAWAIDPDALDDLVGGDLIKPRKSRVVDDVRQMVGGDLDSLFREIASGKLDPTHPYRYRRIAELACDHVGKKLSGGATKPGRGWQALAPAWKHWKLPAIAKAWSAVSAWPWRGKSRVEWPRLLIISELSALERELKAFDSAIVVERGVPKSVPRFGEGEWPMDDLAGELEHLVATWRTWLAAAKREKLSLAIWHDGDS
jgi:hypothetical protein